MILNLASSPLELQCEWCGDFHTAQALCTQRPRARGVTRRSFLALFGAGVAGFALAPSGSFQALPSPTALDIESFGQMTARMWVAMVGTRPGDLFANPALAPFVNAHFIDPDNTAIVITDKDHDR